jgi:hypothetical protein
MDRCTRIRRKSIRYVVGSGDFVIEISLLGRHCQWQLVRTRHHRGGRWVSAEHLVGPT